MRVLIYRWGAYTEEDLIHYFGLAGLKTDVFICELNDKNNDELFEGKIDKVLRDGEFDFVFSVNYFPVVAKICHKLNIRYVSWSYDAPLNVVNIEETLGLSTNKVYMFDRQQVNFYRAKGFDNVEHLPLAVPVERYDRIKVSENDKKKYGSSVSFVGSLYNDLLGSYISPLGDYDKGYITAICKAQSNIYGAYIVNDNITDQLIDRINERYREVNPDTKIVMSWGALSYAMASHVTREDRLTILGVLSSKCDLKYFSGENNDILKNATYGGRVDYINEMPKVFKSSTVNLNITLRILQSGIPLRALDIMGCGGFLLSNYQPELAEYFNDGEEMVMYTSIEDAIEKALFYAKNTDEAKRIGCKGYEKVKKEYDYKSKVKEIIEDLDEA